MNSDNKKQLIIFLAAGIALLLLITVLSSMDNTHGEYFGTGNDVTPPVTSIEYAKPFLEIGGEKWINTNTTVYINATDESGPAEI